MNAFYACNYSFASECEYSRLKAKDFASILSRQLVEYPFPKASSFGRRVVRPGQVPPQWFELIPGRFTSQSILPNPNALVDVTNNEVQPRSIGKTTLKPGWSCGVLSAALQPDGAPMIPIDIREAHKQTKVHAGPDNDGKKHRPQQCKLCQFHGLKQKKPPYLCADCRKFFCHDFETGAGSAIPQQCYWTHMCISYRDSGLSTAVWNSSSETWNQERVSKCKESDGIH